MAIRDHKRPSCGIGTAGFAIVRAANAVFDPQLSSQIDTAKQVTAPRQAFLPTRQLFLPRIDSRFLLPGRRSLPQLNCYPAAELRGGVVEEMVRQLSMATRRELKDAIRERYQAAANQRERRQILSARA